MQNREALLSKIKEIANSGNDSELNELLSEELLNTYNDSDLFGWKAYVSTKLKLLSPALEYAKKAIMLNQTNAFAYLQKGFALAESNDWENALTEYSKAIELSPKYAYAYNLRGLLFSAQGLHEKAIAEYDKSIELNNNYEQAYSNRGVAWHDLGAYDKAILDYNQALAINPDFYVAYNNRGNAFRRIKKYEEALNDYDTVIKLKPSFSKAYSNKGIVLDDLREYDKAIVEYNKAIELNPNNHINYSNRGVSWANKNEHLKAISDFTKAIDLQENYARAYINRGDSYYYIGNFAYALSDYQKAINLNPGYSHLDYKIKLAKEKIEERRRLEISRAEQADKDKKLRLEKQIERLLEVIKAESKSQVNSVVHYTKLSVAEIYVKSLSSKMNYSNAIYMNDPMEGKIFFEYLNDSTITEAFANGEKRTETSVYLGSFLPAEENNGEASHEDELVMWRTYGKNEVGKEAAGCCIVLKSDFFSAAKEKKDESSLKDTPEDGLLNVVYVKNNKTIKEISNDENGKISEAIDKLKIQLRKLIKLRDKYSKNDDFYKEIENTIFKLLSTVSYLFKSADYHFEHEVRIITYMPRNSDLVKHRENTQQNAPNKRFYIESYNDILPYIKKIYLGPKVEHHQQWSLYFDYEIRQRAKEIENVTPQPYLIKPSEIEILQSICKFQ